MSTFAILKLPRELQDEILSYISRPTDLKALCLVSKEISAISTPRLYRDINLRYGTEYPDRLSLCLTRLSHSRSLGHVQTIKIGYLGEPNQGNQGYCSALSHLLPKLRDNSLIRFEFDELTRPTHKQLRFLWQHQKRLHNLQLDFKTYPPTVSDHEHPTHLLRSLRLISELDLDFESATVDSEVLPLLKTLDLSHLQKLRLASLPKTSSGPSEPLKLRKILFSDYFPATLTHLTLCFVSFIDNNLQLNDYPSLTHLALRWCNRSLDLFAGYSRPTLMSLSLVEHSHLAGLSDMLHRFRGLESLAICISRPIEDSKTVDFLVDAIDRHKDTLKYLLFHHDWRKAARKSLLFDTELFNVIMTCRNLSQLGISIYKTNMVDICKGLLEELPSLVTLIVYFQSSSAAWNTDLYSAFDAKIANQVMSDVSDSSKFSLFAFGKSRVPWKRYYTLSMQRQCFVRHRNTQELVGQSRSGGAEGVVIRTKARLAKYLVSECDLMDFSHELTLEKDLKYQRWIS
ncbi:hypothetical protein MMC29_005589, partial [Sticta canariensis]|nr:hypothetical protein [Sticta canariensis]